MIQSFQDERAKCLMDGRRVVELVNVEEQARTRLIRLDSATTLADLRALRGNRLGALSGSRKGQFSIRINDQYRICFHSEGAHEIFRSAVGARLSPDSRG
jgi:proteic killer suppression protein